MARSILQAERLPRAAVEVRWGRPADAEDLVAIEREAFGRYAWDAEDFRRAVADIERSMLVATHDGVPVAYIVWEPQPGALHIDNLAVHRGYRRRGIGRLLVDRLKDRMAGNRHTIYTEVRETNDLAHKFLRGVGFYATVVLRDFYDTCEDDAYQFVWKALSAKQDCRGR